MFWQQKQYACVQIGSPLGLRERTAERLFCVVQTTAGLDPEEGFGCDRRILQRTTWTRRIEQVPLCPIVNSLSFGRAFRSGFSLIANTTKLQNKLSLPTTRTAPRPEQPGIFTCFLSVNLVNVFFQVLNLSGAACSTEYQMLASRLQGVQLDRRPHTKRATHLDPTARGMQHPTQGAVPASSLTTTAFRRLEHQAETATQRRTRGGSGEMTLCSISIVVDEGRRRPS